MKLLHFQYKAGERPYNDGPSLVSFSTKPISIDNKVSEVERETLKNLERKSQSTTGSPEYLLFLKKRNDGRYEAVSGQLDPTFSARILLPHVVSRGEKGPGKDAQPPAITHVCSQANAAKTAAPKGFNVTPAQALEKAQPYFPSNPFALAVYADSRFYYVERTGTTLFAAKDHLERVREYGIKIDGETGDVVRGVKRPPVK